ncbi:MAG: tannase/feruloyl esterase family alpha/beta hydrolase [Chloroflexi bacterium]|nr:tannase/feruloyl esterase family alpha/beta hydrolase [Chloroflexota bacterium]
MKQFSILLTVALLAFLISGSITNQIDSVVSASEMDCTSVTADSLGLENVEITRAELVTNDPDYPAYCLLQGNANARTGIDGKHYAIAFELRLPVAWNGRFLHQVNGGNDGAVLPATGGSNATGSASALARGFAVLSTDAGHNGMAPVNAELGLVGGNVFGLDPQARSDYGYAAVGTMTPIAKSVIEQYYGTAPDYSYMAGCSNGGRHGMVTASRYGEDYDGILVGNPGFNLPRAAIQHAWDVQSFQIADPDIRQAFSREDMALVAEAVVFACDALDGAEDGLVADINQCQTEFDLAELECGDGEEDLCLSPNQITALGRSMSGPTNSDGEQLYSDWSYDSGMSSGDWRFWKLESGIPPWDNYPLIATLGGGSLSYIFTTPPTETPGDPASLVAYLTEFDFDEDAPRIYATDDTFSESAMEFMTPPDVDDPMLAAFHEAGGKLLIYHGQSDGVFSVNDTINWYEALTENNGGDASDFARLFTVPGMNHCSGGPTTDQFDALSALMTWVETGVAPDQIIASVDPMNPELPVEWSPTRTRPLCPWPEIAVFSEGDIETAASFTCEVP